MSHHPLPMTVLRYALILALPVGLLVSCSPTPTAGPPETPTQSNQTPASMTPTGPAATPVEDATADSDGDALLDVWETNGYDHDADGTPEWDLAALGADPQKKDIFVEIDWMEAPGRSHIPKQGMVQRAIQMFANAPVENPDGSTGIKLHVELSNSIPQIERLGSSFGSVGYDWSAFDNVKQANFHPSKAPIWHYVIFGNNYGNTTSSGISRGIPGSDVLVTLGSFDETVDEQTGTFVHELGHNLGLTHGGVGHVNFKPNYLSVMNYLFQMTGLCRASTPGATTCSFGDFDYSRWDAPALAENALSEPDGLGTDYAGFGTLYQCSSSGLHPAFMADKDIDWNCNNAQDATNVAQDINGDGMRTTLNIQSNWANLIFDGGLVGKGTDPTGGRLAAPNQPDSTQYEELTAEMFAEIRSQLEENAGYSVPPAIVRAPPMPTPEPGQSVIYSSDAPDGTMFPVPPELLSPAQRKQMEGAAATPPTRP